MKKNLIKSLIFGCIILHNSFAQVMWKITDSEVKEWKLQLADEFDGDKINTNQWKYWYGWGRCIYGQKEQQYYTDGKNIYLKDGIMYMWAKREKFSAKLVDWMSENDSLKMGNKYIKNMYNFNYTSGLIQSLSEFQYGYFEIRFKSVRNKGTWPAFWLYGGSPNEEIDIFELKGERRNQIHIGSISVHPLNKVKIGFSKRSWSGWVKVNKNIDEGFNTFSCEWDSTKLVYYMNGQILGVSYVPMKVRKNVVINMAIPANDGPFHPGPDNDLMMSDSMQVDYVRCWTDNLNVQARSTTVHQVNTPAPVPNNQGAKMKKRVKYLLDKKKGVPPAPVFLSVINGTGNKFHVYADGLAVGQSINCEVVNSQNSSVNKLSIDKEYTSIDLSKENKGNYTLKFTYGTKQTSYQVTVN